MEGDLVSRSDVRRRWGVAPVYKSRVAIGVDGCGRAGERESDASPGDVLYEYDITFWLQRSVRRLVLCDR